MAEEVGHKRGRPRTSAASGCRAPAAKRQRPVTRASAAAAAAAVAAAALARDSGRSTALAGGPLPVRRQLLLAAAPLLVPLHADTPACRSYSAAAGQPPSPALSGAAALSPGSLPAAAVASLARQTVAPVLAAMPAEQAAEILSARRFLAMF